MGLFGLVVDGLALGAVYALTALGFVLVLNGIGALNFAHGDLATLGGFLAIGLAALLPDWPGIVILPIVALLVALAGLALSTVAQAPGSARPRARARPGYRHKAHGRGDLRAWGGARGDRGRAARRPLRHRARAWARSPGQSVYRGRDRRLGPGRRRRTRGAADRADRNIGRQHRPGCRDRRGALYLPAHPPGAAARRLVRRRRAEARMSEATAA